MQELNAILIPHSLRGSNYLDVSSPGARSVLSRRANIVAALGCCDESRSRSRRPQSGQCYDVASDRPDCLSSSLAWGGGRNKLDDPLTFKTSSKIALSLETSSKVAFDDFIKHQKSRTFARQAPLEPLNILLSSNHSSKIALSLETSSKFCR